MWLGVGISSLIFSRLILRRYIPKLPYSLCGAFCAALNSLPIAFIFSPTFLISGWFGFPAPATFVLFCCLFDSDFKHNKNELIRKNLGLAVIAFSSFWFCAWLFNFLRSSKKLQRESSTDLQASVAFLVLVFGIPSILLAALIYYFGFCYAQSPAGISVFSGP